MIETPKTSVIPGSIQFLRNDFDELYYLLLAPNYVVHFNCDIFEYDPDVFLKNPDFNLIYPGFSYYGDMRISTFKKCYREINELLSYKSCMKSPTQDEIKKIKTTFWGIVEKYVELPAAVNFKFHEYRIDAVFWECAYIFLNKSKGIYISMQAND
ncbi:MAG: hypothetical protein ACOYT8_00940 [Candidatus Dependentiae bacterium]